MLTFRAVVVAVYDADTIQQLVTNGLAVSADY